MKGFCTLRHGTGIRTPMALALAVIGLTGCGGGGSGSSGDPVADDLPGLTLIGFAGEGPGELTSPWHVNMTFFRRASNTPGSGDADVQLVRYDDTFRVSAHVEHYAPQMDTCDLRRQDEPDGGSGSGGSAPPSISGGSQLFVDAAGERFFTFAAQLDGAETFYDTDDGLPGPLPDAATLTIPGDAFPALLDYPLPDEPPVPVRVLPLEGESITSVSEYSWMPGSANDVVELEFIAYDTAGEFIDFAIVCAALDDGSFVMPADARAEIDAIDDELQLRYTRERQQIELRDDITIRSRVIVAE